MINSVRHAAVTTFAFSSVFILLLCFHIFITIIASAPTRTGSVFTRRFRLFLGQCTSGHAFHYSAPILALIGMVYTVQCAISILFFNVIIPCYFPMLLFHVYFFLLRLVMAGARRERELLTRELYRRLLGLRHGDTKNEMN